MANPTLLTSPFCVAGEKNDIPAMQPAQGDGRFNQYTGFPSETSIPTINGGKNVSRQDMNGAFYFLSNILFRVQKGKIFEWNDNQDYYTPAIVVDNNTIYLCKQDAPVGTVRPINDITNTYWQDFSSYLYQRMTIRYADIVGVPTKLSQFSNAETDFQNRTQVSKSISTAITPINAIIPAEATATNQLADKEFVNSTVQTATANFRGNWNNWEAVPSNAASYPADYAGKKTPTTNDYISVQDASDYPVAEGETQLKGTWRFKYTGIWATNNKNGWRPEYQINREPLTEAQIKALNSGVVAEDVAQITTNKNNIALKANTSDLSTVALSGEYEDIKNRFILEPATAQKLGGVKQGGGTIIDADGTIRMDTATVVEAIDWTQLNTSEKLYNNGSSGIINLSNGRVQITTATTIQMPAPLPNCATWVTLWCNSGSVTFDTTYAPVYFEDGNEPPAGNGVFVYTLASIGGVGWYCLFTGMYRTA